jgi:UDP-GlcNAc:undecaprenyl-phosphate GlcNAc-1-phosphate transferase
VIDIGGAFIVSLVCTAASIPLAIKLGVIDVPGLLKAHSEATPRLGGLGIFAGVLAGLWPLDRRFGPVLIGAAVMFLVGVVDDRFGVTPRQKLVGQAVAGLVLAYTLVSVNPGLLGLLYGFLGFSLAVILANAINLIDGMDGLAGGNAFLVFAALAVLGALHGIASAMTAVAGAAILGFLPFNFPRPRTFMGDCGSLLIGYLLAFALIQLLEKNVMLFVDGLIASIVPIFDLSLGIVRRLSIRKPIFSGDRGHFYDRIARSLRNDRWAVIITYLMTASCAGLAIWASLRGLPSTLTLVVLLSASLAILTVRLGWLRTPSAALE